ncbi:MAG: helix-turn-helix domain-containing protein [Hyphomicrobiaceae bacterium]
MDKIIKHVAGQLRAARLAKGLTQEALAGELGMATESISHIERGITVPGLKTIAAVADALDIGVADIFDGLANDRPTSRRRAQQEATLRRLAGELDDARLALAVELVEAVARSR